MSAIDATAMDDDAGEEAPRRNSRAPLLIGFLLALLLGGGGFFAVFAGYLTLPAALSGAGGEGETTPALRPGDAPAFVPVGEMVIPLGPEAMAQFLVIETSIEARPEDAAALEALRPRVLDVFNTFLRAVEEADLEAPSATIRLRAQLLRRVRAVAAPIEPRDLLITSFVLK